MMTITLGLIPHDERPVSLIQPAALLANAGISVLTPPVELLGHRTLAGQPGQILDWLSDHCTLAAVWVVSLDMLAYGGLVASRSITEAEALILSRFERLRELHCLHPHIQFYAYQSIRRLSITVANQSDVGDWELAHHSSALAPNRDRNRRINLAAIQLVKNHTLAYLSLLQEDARPQGPQLEDQALLQAAIHGAGVAHQVKITSGTDEGGAVLLARAVREIQTESPQSVYLFFSSEAGAEQISLYEDCTIRETVSGQVKIAGLDRVLDPELADCILAVWCPDTPQHDLMFTEVSQAAETTPDTEYTEFIQRISQFVTYNQHVAIADLRFANGADPKLCKALAAVKLFSKLVGYSAWNTSANAVGFAVASAIISSAGNAWLWLRLLEDWAYQAELRFQVQAYCQAQALDVWNIPESALPPLENMLTIWMQEWHRLHLAPDFPDYQVCRCLLPWQRAFEILIR